MPAIACSFPRIPRAGARRSSLFMATVITATMVTATLSGVICMPPTQARGDERPAGPRGPAWQAIEKALAEGKPQTAAESLRGIEQAAIAERSWAEAARAIAPRVRPATGDRPPDDPTRLLLLAAAIDRAPAETRGVLEAIRANWTWGFFQMNRWRYQQRTQGGADAGDLTKIAEWDLPTIVREIRARFAAAVAAPGSPARAALEKLPVAEWSAILRAGTMPDAYRPTVWDVIVRDALDFSASGERGLVAPEDAFEIDAAGPALGSDEAFLAWKPELDPAVTDADSPLLDTIRLYRDLLAFHRQAGADRDPHRTAFLSADLDRILWAGSAAVAAGEATDLFDRKEEALRGFIERAGDHETAALARFHLATLLHQGSGRQDDGDPLEARGIAAAGAASHPKSPGGVSCQNLVAQIDAPELSLATEASWAQPWPVVRVTYRNLTRVHVRLARADFAARLAAGKPQAGWLDDADRRAILGLPAARTLAADLPATPDFRQRHHDIPVEKLVGDDLDPGTYWVIASHRPDFGEKDNVVFVTLVRLTRLAIVSAQPRPVMAPAIPGQAVAGPRDRVGISGHVVDLESGEPVAAATVTLFLRGQQGGPPPFTPSATATTDQDGRYEFPVDQQREYVLVAAADRDGRRHEAATEPAYAWRQEQPGGHATVVLVTDRGIHRPGQFVHYKGIACATDFARATAQAVAGREVEVVLRDANGREVSKARHTTSVNGSFHGGFPIPTGGLPGQWSIQALVTGAGGFGGGMAVRVEEYKRPKFLVTLAAPEKPATLGGEVSLSGTATTYTGVAVSAARVKWHVERQARWPFWCRGLFPWLPFDAGSQRIARGTAVTDERGRFTLTFPARPDRGVPPESLPVFTYSVVVDVTDSSGETRGDRRGVSVGYTDVEATVSADEWQAAQDGRPVRGDRGGRPSPAARASRR
ncbi:MAG: MG2 domain-containing protein [Planctomycetia bacterium]